MNVRAKDLVSDEQLAQVRARSNLRGLWLVFHAWAIIVAAMVVFAIWTNPVTFLVCAFIIGGRQLGLSILVHDAAHGLLLDNRQANNTVSQWLCAWPTFADTGVYRTYHLKHHARTQQPDDPDLVLSAPFPVTRKSLMRKFLRDLSGQTGLSQRLAQIQAGFGKPEWPAERRRRHFLESLGGPLAINTLLLAILSLAGYWWLYPALWLIPLLTTYQLVLRIRNIAEHAMVPDDSDPFRNARTTMANTLERIFLAPYWVNYHVEHHLLMWVPCYNLAKLHRFIQAGPQGHRVEKTTGYLNVLRMASSLSDDEDRRGNRVQTKRRRFAGLVMEEDSAPT